MAKKPKPLFTGPWYPWYVDDVNESERVGEMSLSEEAAYRRLLDYQWKKGSVPNNAEKLATIVKKRCTTKIAAAVLRMFEPMAEDPSRAQNPTLEKRRAEQEEFHNKKVRDGQKGALKRWGKTSYIDSSAIRQPLGKDKQSNSYINRKETKRKEKKRKEEETNLSAVVGSAETSPQEKTAAPRTGKKPTNRGTRIPQPFNLTRKMRDWAEKECPQVDAITETKKFTNHYRAATGQKATKRDWEATWENWILNARDRYGVNRNGNSNRTNGNAANRNEQRIDEADQLVDALVTVGIAEQDLSGERDPIG